MKLSELTEPCELRRIITYSPTKKKAVYHNRFIQHINGNIYRGVAEKSGGNDQFCTIYVCYPEATPEIGLDIGTISTDCSVADVVEKCKQNSIDTAENFVSKMQEHIKNQDHVQLSMIELLKYIDPSLVEPCMDARRIFAENQRKREQEQKEKREAEEKAFVQQKNIEAEQIVNEALDIIRNGGKLENKTVTFYKSRYNNSSYSVVNYLMRKYGIRVPLVTQGWIIKKLVNVNINGGRCENIQYYKENGAKYSQKFFECMNELIVAVNTGRCDVNI